MNEHADKISDTEAEVMKVVWKHNRPVTYAEIRSDLNGRFDWGSQVINTMVKRLVQKEALAQEKKEVYYYSALVSEEDYLKSKTLTFVQKVYGGSGKGLISALIDYDEVTQEDLDELRTFWKKARNEDE